MNDKEFEFKILGMRNSNITPLTPMAPNSQVETCKIVAHNRVHKKEYASEENKVESNIIDYGSNKLPPSGFMSIKKSPRNLVAPYSARPNVEVKQDKIKVFD